VRARKTRHALAWIGIGIALWLGGLGMFISFYPGAEAEWFGTAAVAAAFGLLSPKWRLRLAGFGLAATFGWFAWAGYQRGLEHQQWLREHRHTELGLAPDRRGE
jgi:hypothetical protein